MNTKIKVFGYFSIISFSYFMLTGASVYAGEYPTLVEALHIPHLTNVKNIKAKNSAVSVSDTQKANEVKRSSEQVLGRALYKTIENPKRAQKKLINFVTLSSFRYFGMEEEAKEFVYFIKDNTRYQLGECSEVRLSYSKIKWDHCIAENKAINLHSNYSLESVMLSYQWMIDL